MNISISEYFNTPGKCPSYIIPEDIECTICCEPIDESKNFRKLVCNHYFHTTCIHQWFIVKKECPNCKLKFIQQ